MRKTTVLILALIVLATSAITVSVVAEMNEQPLPKQATFYGPAEASVTYPVNCHPVAQEKQVLFQFLPRKARGRCWGSSYTGQHRIQGYCSNKSGTTIKLVYGNWAYGSSQWSTMTCPKPDAFDRWYLVLSDGIYGSKTDKLVMKM
jgi:hypothetical protein